MQLTLTACLLIPQISAEAIDNIRTVVSLGIEGNFYKKFVGSLVLLQK